jgi:Mlc titration factor MtfA (ptsG expression regulator)
MGGVYGLLFVTRRLVRFLPAGKPFRLPSEPVPETWPRVLERLVPLSRRLPEEERVRLLRLAQLFVRDVPMEGCGGLELTEEIRVAIAATACLLVMNLPYPRFAALRRVLVYPDTFVPRRMEFARDRGIQSEPDAELGEAWRDGIVVLSWNAVRAADANAGHGRNVVLHEFAHVLDGEDGAFDGTPILESEQDVRDWSRIFAAEFEREQHDVDYSDDPALDPYAATNRAEFFAVATETFFESPARLRGRLPDLYEQLRRFYRQDPATRHQEAE